MGETTQVRTRAEAPKSGHILNLHSRFEKKKKERKRRKKKKASFAYECSSWSKNKLLILGSLSRWIPIFVRVCVTKTVHAKHFCSSAKNSGSLTEEHACDPLSPELHSLLHGHQFYLKGQLKTDWFCRVGQSVDVFWKMSLSTPRKTRSVCPEETIWTLHGN